MSVDGAAMDGFVDANRGLTRYNNSLLPDLKDEEEELKDGWDHIVVE